MKLVALQSVMSIGVARLLVAALPPRPRRFRRADGFPSIPAPALLRQGVHPLVSFTSPTEYVAARHPTVYPEANGHLLGSLSPSRHQYSESTDDRCSTTCLPVRPQRFSRSRRVTPPRTSWACFIPQPRPGFTLQGFSPLFSRRASSTRRALLSLTCVACRLPKHPVPAPQTSPSGR
jgi:hypothetical protein